ncbi:MAG TPA: DUF4139 domain-containing protein, partial [Methanosarcina sp.]
MGVKKLFFWLTVGFIWGILLISVLILQNMGVLAQEYEPGNNTSWISSSSGTETMIKPQYAVRNLTSEATGNLTSEKVGAVGNTEITVYEQEIALVKERREIELQNGINQVKYTDIPSGIDPTSVILEDPENKNT